LSSEYGESGGIWNEFVSKEDLDSSFGSQKETKKSRNGEVAQIMRVQYIMYDKDITNTSEYESNFINY
jgi:hypothetical protein